MFVVEQGETLQIFVPEGYDQGVGNREATRYKFTRVLKEDATPEVGYLSNLNGDGLENFEGACHVRWCVGDDVARAAPEAYTGTQTNTT